LRHRDPALLQRATLALAATLRERFGRRLSGPVPPPIDRVRGEYLLALRLKIEQGASLLRANRIVAEALKNLAQHPEYKSVVVSANVDPH
jgi:primosomal protein N' (replication factor Y)